MSNTAIDTDVLIVGAGPVGLLLANECARRGLRWRLVEAHASQSAYSKALAVFPRTLELLDMAGVVGPFLELANRVASVTVVSRGRRLARLPFAPASSPYPFIAMIPQNVTERLLAEKLSGHRGKIEYETKFVTATQDEESVSVSLERRGQPLTLRAAFVVGCDGAHSAVRHLLALPFEGAAYDAAFMLADIDTDDALRADELQLCPDASGPLAIFPMGARRARIVAIVDGTEGSAPSLELVRRLLAERAGGSIEAHALHWSSYFRVHHRQAAGLRVGRIFVAGDAAHIHSPFGGQGMNTGLHDAWNLAWKLDLAVRGHAREALLDSYTAERGPVIRQVIATTDRLTKVMGTPSRWAQTLRDTLIPRVSRWAAFQKAFVSRLSGLGLDYGHSPIVRGGGKRYFDDSVRGGTGIGSRYLLVSSSEESSTATEAMRAFADAFTSLVEHRPAPGRETLLVRPDGYVAYRASSGDAAALSTIRSLLERQVRP